MIIPIEKDRIPYRFDVKFDSIYTFEIHYNREHDFFTLDLFRGDTALAYGEKLVLEKPLFQYVPESLPVIKPTGEAQRVTYDNLGETVFLEVEDND